MLICFLLWNTVSALAKSNVITVISLSGPNVTTATCPSTAYLSCYYLTMSRIDAFGLTAASGMRTIVNPNTASPTSTLWISDSNISFQVGNALNGQLASIGIYQVTAGFSHGYLNPEYCVTGCSNNSGFTTFAATNTTIYSNVSEGPTGGPASQYPISLAALINAGNGVNFAGFGTSGVSGDTFQFDIRVTSSTGNKTADALVTVDVQQAATAILSNISYFGSFGTVTGLPISPTQAVTSNPFAGTLNYNGGYTYTPQFSQFSATTGTLAAYVSMDFAPALAASTLALCDASANTSTAVCTPLSKSSSTPTTISTSLTDNTPLSHYLGLVVAEGAGFPGNSTSANTNATVTLIFSVP